MDLWVIFLSLFSQALPSICADLRDPEFKESGATEWHPPADYGIFLVDPKRRFAT